MITSLAFFLKDKKMYNVYRNVACSNLQLHYDALIYTIGHFSNPAVRAIIQSAILMFLHLVQLYKHLCKKLINLDITCILNYFNLINSINGMYTY